MFGQEARHRISTLDARAPGHIPGDLELFPRGQPFQYLVMEPVYKAKFSVHLALGSKGELLLGREDQALWVEGGEDLHWVSPSLPIFFVNFRIPHHSGFSTKATFSASPLTRALSPVEARSTGESSWLPVCHICCGGHGLRRPLKEPLTKGSYRVLEMWLS